MKKDLKKGISILFFILIILLVYIDHRFISREEVDIKIISEEKLPEYHENIIDSKITLMNYNIKNNEKKQINDDVLHDIYVTVLPPKSDFAIPFKDLNNQQYSAEEGYVSDSNDPYVEVSVQYDLPSNINNNLGLPNATMELRGQSSRKAPLKSYKLKLLDGTELWNGFKTINLNKHYYRKNRISNKLSFDYFNEMNDVVAAETYFVRLFICDKSENIFNVDFEDYGLYTFVEQPNKRFLERNGLDKNGMLYKAEYFEFFRYENAIKLYDDYEFDMGKFESHLEVMGSNNHKDLINMLNAVNDYNRDIDEVIEEYFDRENILTWMAANILFDNYDIQSRNFILYSPLNSSKWSFIPWDCDGGFTGNFELRSKWATGVSNYWGMVVFKRFLKEENNRKDLTKKIIELKEIVNKETVFEKVKKYYEIIEPVIFNSKDREHIEISSNMFKKEVYKKANFPKENFDLYLESLEKPLPFHYHKPIKVGEKYRFQWGEAYDFQNEKVTYTFELSSDPRFKSGHIIKKDLEDTTFVIDGISPGTYFWRVIAYDESGNWQYSFKKTIYDGRAYFGVDKLVINEDNINE